MRYSERKILLNLAWSFMQDLSPGMRDAGRRLEQVIKFNYHFPVRLGKECSNCNGNGYILNSKQSICTVCEGEGNLIAEVNTEVAQYDKILDDELEDTSICSDCQGNGKIVTYNYELEETKACPKCNGKGKIK